MNHPHKRYIGVSADVVARVSAHNAGQNRSTAPWKPWSVDVTIEFRTERMALRFEKYLKSGAGHAFANRHLADVPGEFEFVRQSLELQAAESSGCKTGS